MVLQKKISSNLITGNLKLFQIGVLLLVLGMVSCAEVEVIKEAPQVNTVPENTKFRIILPESHKNAETWQLQEEYDNKTVERLNEVWHGEEKGIYFNLKTLSTGQTTLTFVKRIYTDTTDYKRFIIKSAKH